MMLIKSSQFVKSLLVTIMAFQAQASLAFPVPPLRRQKSAETSVEKQTASTTQTERTDGHLKRYLD